MNTKLVLIISLAFAAITSNAQDVIVKKDGSTVLAKVLEVNQVDIKYKKFSNQNGPTYTIDKAEVMAINYEGGDKDTFNSQQTAKPALQASAAAPSSDAMSPALRQANQTLIDQYNARMFSVNGKSNKKGKNAYCKLNFTSGSMLANEDVELRFETSGGWLTMTTNSTNLKLFVKNKTNKTIYVDLANTFLSRGDIAQAFYVPSATSKTSGTTTGGSVNLGAVAGAVGVGGALGTLANGVTLGKSNSSSSTTIEYAQRIVSIPPMSALPLPEMPMILPEAHNMPFILISHVSTGIKLYYRVSCGITGLMAGDVVHWDEQNTPMRFPLFLTYSKDENLTEVKSMQLEMYASDLLGIGRSADNGMPLTKPFSNLFDQQSPLHLLMRNDPEDFSAPININDLNFERKLAK